jgi:putative addiction module component (TIGR02574 family)
MTRTEQILEAALELSDEERTLLIDALLESLIREDSRISEEVREELERRLAAYGRDPAAGSCWPEVKARLLAGR